MKNILPILLALFVTLAACEKEIPFDAEVTQPKLVLNSLFTSDSVWSVHVSRSLSVIDTGQLDAVFDADVQITDAVGNPVATLLHQGEGVYVADSVRPVPDVLYQIEAKAAGYEPVTASDAIPGAVQIISLDTATRSNGADGLDLEVEITFADPAGTANFYMVEVDWTISFVAYQDTETFTIPLGMACTDPYIESGGGFDNYYPYLLLRDDNLDGQTYSLAFTLEGLASQPDIKSTVRVSLISSSEAFFNYRRSYQSYIGTVGNPFAQPVQVYSNVQGGFGIFAGGTRAVWELEL